MDLTTAAAATAAARSILEASQTFEPSLAPSESREETPTESDGLGGWKLAIALSLGSGFLLFVSFVWCTGTNTRTDHNHNNNQNSITFEVSHFFGLIPSMTRSSDATDGGENEDYNDEEAPDLFRGEDDDDSGEDDGGHNRFGVGAGPLPERQQGSTTSSGDSADSAADDNSDGSNIDSTDQQSDDEVETLLLDRVRMLASPLLDAVTATAGQQDDSPVESGPSPFLTDEEKWSVAKYVFPGRLDQNYRYDVSHIPHKSVEDEIWDRVWGEYRTLWILKPARMEELVRHENAVDLCEKLGINRVVAEKRFEVVGNLRRELSEELDCVIQCVTPTIVQIRHLVYGGFGVRNSYGEREHINDGTDKDACCVVRESYKGKDWQSYFGIQLQSGNTKSSVRVMKNTIEELNLKDCYVHGTNGKALQGINKQDGELIFSVCNHNKAGIRHDFGNGFYCVKGEYVKALTWAIDSAWPIYDSTTSAFQPAGSAFPSANNPALVVFPKPEGNHDVFDVHSKPPFSDKFLERLLGTTTFKEFIDKRKSYTQDKHWQSFVKLARYYNIVRHGQVFEGRVHNTKTVHKTDNCEAPVIDKDKNFKQYCFVPNSVKYLGTKRLFIEFNVDWNEWLDKAKQDESTFQQRVHSAMDDGKTNEEAHSVATKLYVDDSVKLSDKK